jgi:hypothetical protein
MLDNITKTYKYGSEDMHHFADWWWTERHFIQTGYWQPNWANEKTRNIYLALKDHIENFKNNGIQEYSAT